MTDLFSILARDPLPLTYENREDECWHFGVGLIAKLKEALPLPGDLDMALDFAVFPKKEHDTLYSRIAETRPEFSRIKFEMIYGAAEHMFQGKGRASLLGFKKRPYTDKQVEDKVFSSLTTGRCYTLTVTSLTIETIEST